MIIVPNKWKTLKFHKRRKKKQYAGGKDEGELKVQVQLVKPVRKLVPEEAEEEPAEPSTQD